MNCTKCRTNLGGPKARDAGIAVLVGNGNEVIHSYFYCEGCGSWSIEHFEDDFMTGDTSVWTTGPLRQEEGLRCTTLIEKCPDPMNKHCRCEAHAALLRGVPSS